MSTGTTGQPSAETAIKPLEGHRLALTLLVLAYT